jgi:hypothetical protein
MSIESLLRLAGERDQPSVEGIERARAAARLSWQRARARGDARDRPRRGFAIAMAASLVAVIAVGAWWRREMPKPVDLARVSAIQGEVGVEGAHAPLATDGILHSGEILATQEGRVALTFGDSLSLRVDRQSRLRFTAAGRVRLIEGVVYVDSGGLNARASLRIDTPAGVVRHVGTQFQVQVRDGRTRVQVREGRVVIAAENRSLGSALDLAAGDLAEISGTRIRIEHGQPGHGDGWDWAALTAPAFDIENRPLSEFLAWLAREHGWQVRFGEASLQTRIQGIRLHGSVEGLDAAGMLERVALITGVPLAERDGALWVGQPVRR